MFDINLTKSAIDQIEKAQELNRLLSRLMTDIAAGRGYVIMNGASTVSVVARQQGEARIVKVYPTALLQAKRYTKEEATKRHRAVNDPTQFEVVRLREAIARQGEALNAYLGELTKFNSDACRDLGMEVTA